MGAIFLPTKNNLIKLQNTIKQRKNGQKLLEDKSLILKRKLEEYKIEKLKIEGEIQKLSGGEGITCVELTNQYKEIEVTKEEYDEYCRGE